MKIVIVILVLLVNLISYSAFSQSSEYLIKAAFIERFTRFIKWPEESIVSDTNNTFVLAVIDKNPFDEKLEEIFKGKEIRHKKVEILFISELSDISKCNLLFISKSEKNRISDIITQTEDTPILTIADSKGFAEMGILINMYIYNDEIRFEINETEAQDSGLRLSYLLLDAAKIINNSKEE